MKLKVQAQSLQPGDVVGSGEVIVGIVVNSTSFPSDKVKVFIDTYDRLTDELKTRTSYWGKYTMINVERKDERSI